MIRRSLLLLLLAIPSKITTYFTTDFTTLFSEVSSDHAPTCFPDLLEGVKLQTIRNARVSSVRLGEAEDSAPKGCQT